MFLDSNRKIFQVALISLLFVLLLSGCIESEENNTENEFVESKKAEIDLYFLSYESIFPSDYVIIDAQDELNFEIRKCDFEKGLPREKPLSLSFERPIVSIHSLENTRERNTVIAGTQVKYDENYVQTIFAPILSFVIVNSGDANSGQIKFSFETQSNGDLQFGNIERFSFSAGYRKKSPEDLWDKQYFITKENEYVVLKVTRTNFDEVLSENEITLDEAFKGKVLTICNDDILDYTKILGEKIPCKQSFKEIKIDNLEPNEIAKVSFFYFPMQRKSWEAEYPVNPKYYFPIKEKEDELTEIKIYYENQNSKNVLLKINLHHSLNEFSFDNVDDICS